jgi:diaminohydroxyphosphoribosylaminopyrimidine deaminase/5-amino-6-(5-phosphoribosylamino)uracil reductase
MRLAIAEMRKTTGPGPNVGAVLVTTGKQVFQGQRGAGIHAERAVVEQALAAGADLKGATLYTTLEPCVGGGSERESCAELIKRLKIGQVWIGRYDTNPEIYRRGWKLLRDAGLVLHDFPPELRTEIDAANAGFAEHFTSGVGPEGGAKLDYHLNEGRFEIRFSETDPRSIITRWTPRGHDSIYAYAVPSVRVALATYAGAFAEIDDPSAFDFSYTVPVQMGEIAVFKSDQGVVLVRVVEVEIGSSTGADRRYVKVQYQVRATPNMPLQQSVVPQ